MLGGDPLTEDRLLDLTLEDGKEYWLVYENFDVILGGMIAAARYRGGYLLQSYSNDDEPPTSGSYLQIEVTGAPGKMKMKGQLTLFSTSSGIMRVQKISAKQIPNP